MEINEKVYIINNNNNKKVGVITKIFEPNEYHSGRFIVHIHDRNREYDYEFWFSDYGKSVLKA